MVPGTTYDAIVIGGGHNGLIAGAYLARGGRRTIVLERRETVGGAAVTETPWGPDYKVTMLSYVVAPGFAGSVLHRVVLGPHDMESTYGLVGGNIFHGELNPSQLFHMRPANGWADCRTPVPGLYHASSATHGGGGVTGIPAVQAVRAIEADTRCGMFDRVRRRVAGGR